MSTLIESFIPRDRRHALISGSHLSDRTEGAGLFADISGFSLLTEALVATLSPQRGAEEMTALLERVYAALTAEIDRYSGSVIGFSGDAITCWFDGDSGLRAITCAFELQAVMQQFASVGLPGGIEAALGVKVAVSIGPARRFLVGDPAVRQIEVLAGATVDQLSVAERLAQRGEIVMLVAHAERLGLALELAELRTAEGSSTQVAVIAGLRTPAAPQPWPELPANAIPADVARPWLLPAIYERLLGDHQLFVNELRQAAALFVGFGGLDYDGDDSAGQLLDAYVRWVQRILARYEGALIDITMGDKGGYLYIVFGPPQAHPDDPARAAEAAIELRNLPPQLAAITRVQIGISAGQVRSGSYGGSTRTFGALGEQVNLAARLMQAAAAGQILMNARLSPLVERRCVLQPLPPIQVKGRRTPMPIVAVAGVRSASSAQLREPRYTLPMVGRTAELTQITTILEQSLSGRGRVVAVMGEAGLGKSRLVSEIIRQAHGAGIACFVGESPSYARSVAYLAWRPIWRDFFELTSEASASEQVAQLARALDTLGPGLAIRMPLLGVVLDLPIAENDLTRTMEPWLRKEVLESLLVECLHIRARRAPALFVLEDAHWLDPLALDLLAALAGPISTLPVLLLLASRPPESEQSSVALQAAIPGATIIKLSELGDDDTQQLITLKLASLFGEQTTVVPAIAAQMAARSQGNPFYIEELLNYLKDYGIDLQDSASVARIELPESLAQLLLSRVDRLSSDEQTTLKVASIIGRLFPASWLRGVYPELGPEERVRRNLESLASLDLTSMHTIEPELNYLFKHVITQEVVYESLPFRLREQLHEQLAGWIEQTLIQAPPLDILAFHYSRSHNRAKQREYYRRAGDAAAHYYANAAAVRYYTALLELPDLEQRLELELALARVLERTGEWDAAEQHYTAAIALAPDQPNSARALATCAMGSMLWGRGRFAEAEAQLTQARNEYQALGDPAGVVNALTDLAAMYRVQGRFEPAVVVLEEARVLAETTGNRESQTQAYHVLGTVASSMGEYAAARNWMEQEVALCRELGDHWGTAVALNNLGLALLDLGDPHAALPLVREAHTSLREMGVNRAAAISQITLGRVLTALSDRAAARRLFHSSLDVFDQMGVRWEIATATIGLARATWIEGDPLEWLERAVRLCGIAEGIFAGIGAVPQANDAAITAALRAAAELRLGSTISAAIWAGGAAMPFREAIAYIQTDPLR